MANSKSISDRARRDENESHFKNRNFIFNIINQQYRIVKMKVNTFPNRNFKSERKIKHHRRRKQSEPTLLSLIFFPYFFVYPFANNNCLIKNWLIKITQLISWFAKDDDGGQNDCGCGRSVINPPAVGWLARKNMIFLFDLFSLYNPIMIS